MLWGRAFWILDSHPGNNKKQRISAKLVSVESKNKVPGSTLNDVCGGRVAAELDSMFHGLQDFFFLKLDMWGSWGLAPPISKCLHYIRVGG